MSGQDNQSVIKSVILDQFTFELTPEAKEHIDKWLMAQGVAGSTCPWGHDAVTATNKYLVQIPSVVGPEALGAPMLFVAVTCTLCGHTELYNVMRVFGYLV